MAKDLSELIDQHQKIWGDGTRRITSIPTMANLRSSSSDKRKKQKRDWYHKNKEKVLKQQKESESKKKNQREWYTNNRERCIVKSKKWNKDNPSARRLIVERHKTKNNTEEVWSNGF